MTNSLPEGQYMDLDVGCRLHYHDQGEGQPIIFIHGSGQGASGWSNFNENAAYFNDKGCRTLMPDLPGFGLSSKPQDIEYHLDFFVDGIHEFVSRLELKNFVLVGNSLGGAISLRYALKYPDQLAKLILMAPGAIEPQETYKQMPGIQSVFKLAYTPGELKREDIEKIIRLQVYDSSNLTDDVIDERFAIAQAQPKEVWKKMKVPYLGDRLEEIECPILVFWGSEDKFLPVSGAQVMASRCKDARNIVLSKCGHWVMKEKTELFNRYSIDFLNEH